jgi:hypothetical protein
VGRVVHHGDCFDLGVRLDGESVHAVARSEGEAGAPVLWQIGRAHGDPRIAVRRLAAAAIGASLALDPAELRIVGRPPMALHRGRPLEASLSLSHHGRFVAFAGRAGR